MSAPEGACVEYSVTVIPNEEDKTLQVTVANAQDPSQVVETLTLNTIFGVPSTRVCNFSRWMELNSHVQYKSEDILIVSYPKCGTTWSEQCVLLLTNGANPDALDPQSKNSYSRETKIGKVWLETMINQDPKVEELMGKEGQCISWEEFDQEIPSPRVIKSHASLNMFLGLHPQITASSPLPTRESTLQALKTLPLGCKLLIVVRNPLDACVSCYYHPKNSPAKRGWPFDAFAEVYLQGIIAYGSFFDWVNDWYIAAQMYPDRIHWVEYEAMKKTPMQATQDLASFLHVLPAENTEEFISKVVTHSSFEEMKKQVESKDGGDRLEHMRGGRVGDWRSHFSPSMAKKMIEKTRASLPTELAERMLGYAGVTEDDLK